MSVYPAGVKQFFRSVLTVADGKTTVINHSCVVKSISAAPCSDWTSASTAESPSVVLHVYDGEKIIMAVAGSASADYSNVNSYFLIPADGLRISNLLAVECKQYNAGGGSDIQNKHANIRIDYQ